MIANSNITKVEDTVLYNHEEKIEVDAVVWTAGIRPVKVVRELGLEMERGRVSGTQYMSLPS